MLDKLLLHPWGICRCGSKLLLANLLKRLLFLYSLQTSSGRPSAVHKHHMKYAYIQDDMLHMHEAQFRLAAMMALCELTPVMMPSSSRASTTPM